MNAVEKYYYDGCQEKIKEIAPLITPTPVIIDTEYDVRFMLKYQGGGAETIFCCHSYETLYAVINAFLIALENAKYYSEIQPE